MLKRESSKKHWERYWASKERAGEYYSNANRVIGQVLNATKVKDKRVLEVGAGTGRDGFRLVDEGAKVLLLDYAEQSLRLMKDIAEQEGKHVLLVKADAMALPFKDGSLDVVFHQGLIEHFQDPLPLLEENYRVLPAGGICIVDVPQKYHIYTVIKHVLMWFNAWYYGWETQFSVRKLRSLICHVGFRTQHFYGDWMRPSLFYRSVREALMHLGIRLPMYPRGPRLVRALRLRLRRTLRCFSWSLNTCLDIGIVAQKPPSPKL